ncbi:hypothetical protein [Ferruginibacter sp.]
MDKLKEFFSENDVRIGIGKDFTTNPPVYYSSLDEAFYHYFLTFRDKKETYHFLFDIHSWSRESLAFNFTGGISNIVAAILGFHRFIELWLKDILRRIDPFLSVKFLEKEEELFQYLNGKLAAEDVKTIEFSEALKRIKQAFKSYEETSQTYIDHLKPYEFIKLEGNIETLKYLSEWRNRIMHNGSTLPNLFALEFLVSQKVIPLIAEVLEAEKKYLKGYSPRYFKTPTGINVMQEILTVKFEAGDFNDIRKSDDLGFALLKLGHLKEIGRSAYNLTSTFIDGRAITESYYNSPVKRDEKFAATERTHEDFFELKNCICCGVNAMVIYRQDVFDFASNSKTFISWLQCYHCGYSLKNNVGDPAFFELCDIPLFATI